MKGRYRPSLYVEQWVSLLLYGGHSMDHLPLLERRAVVEMFGWTKVVDPTSFGRFLRKAGRKASKSVERLLLRAVRARWDAQGRVPRTVMLMFDSTVVQRYGLKQAGAVKGYNPAKKGRPSHHPLLAYLDTGDSLGVRWRAGNANTAAGFEEWVAERVAWLRAQGVERILVRLDKGFFKVSSIEKLLELKVDFVMKMPESKPLQPFKGPFTRSAEDPRLEVAEGRRWGVRMLSVRQCEKAPEGEWSWLRGDEEPGDGGDQFGGRRPDHGVADVQPGRAGGASDRGDGPVGRGANGGGRPGRQRPAVEPGRARIPDAAPGADHGARQGPREGAGEDAADAGDPHPGQAGAACAPDLLEAGGGRPAGEAPGSRDASGRVAETRPASSDVDEPLDPAA